MRDEARATPHIQPSESSHTLNNAAEYFLAYVVSSCLATGATCGTAPTAKALLPGSCPTRDKVCFGILGMTSVAVEGMVGTYGAKMSQISYFWPQKGCWRKRPPGQNCQGFHREVSGSQDTCVHSVRLAC